VLDALDDDLLSLLATLDQTEWSVFWASTCAGATALLCDHAVPVVLCERSLPDGGWQTVLDHVNRTSRPTRFIVTVRFPDERLWAELLNLGAYDLLAKPFRQSEVLRAVTSAWLSWQGEWERRAKHATPKPIR
jgi:DNA-binding NtrC family response regulator